MRERPIVFSAPMIRAILDGRKVQTRRLLAPQPAHLQRHEWRGELVYKGEHRLWCWREHTFENLWDTHVRDADRLELSCMSPYGIVGDRLWVKETVRWTRTGRAIYVADGSPSAITEWPWQRDVLGSIILPRGDSRITLEITEVRVQLLHEIDEDDARAEGVVVGEMQDAIINGERGRAVFFKARDAFAYLWNGINGKRATWSSNPWVWALTFRRLP